MDRSGTAEARHVPQETFVALVTTTFTAGHHVAQRGR
jgi:hypothetical protein